MSKRIKACDIYNVVNYTRNQLRGLLDEVGCQFGAREESQPRIARTYSPHDFLIILIACELESWGLKRSVIGTLLPLVANELTGPRLIASQPKLLLSLKPLSVQYVDGDISVSSGLVLPLTEIFSRVDFQLDQSGNQVAAPQAKLNFDPALIENLSLERAHTALSVRKSS